MKYQEKKSPMELESPELESPELENPTVPKIIDFGEKQNKRRPRRFR